MSVRDIEQKLGQYASLVTIEQAIDCIIVKPRAYIHDKEKWIAINKILRENGGKWVGVSGATGHWEIPLFSQAEVNNHGRLQTALEHAREVVQLLTEEMK